MTAVLVHFFVASRNVGVPPLNLEFFSMKTSERLMLGAHRFYKCGSKFAVRRVSCCGSATQPPSVVSCPARASIHDVPCEWVRVRGLCTCTRGQKCALLPPLSPHGKAADAGKLSFFHADIPCAGAGNDAGRAGVHRIQRSRVDGYDLLADAGRSEGYQRVFQVHRYAHNTDARTTNIIPPPAAGRDCKGFSHIQYLF